MDKRSSAILRLLAESDKYLSIEELAGALNVSKRTIYNDIEKIDHWLTDVHGSQIEKVHGMGISIPAKVKAAIRSPADRESVSYYEYSKEERHAWIFLRLSLDINTPYFIDSFQSLFNVSRNTVIDDIKQVRKCINKQGISIRSSISEGYLVEGNEIGIRQMIMDSVQNLSSNAGHSTEKDLQINMQEKLFTPSDIHLVGNLLSAYEEKSGVGITEDIRPLISTWMLCFYQRMRNGKTLYLEHSEKEAIKAAPEFKIANSIFEQFFGTFTEDESVYFTRILLGAKIRFSKSSDYETENILNLESIINILIDSFQQKAAVTFPEKHSLYQNLLLHMKPAYYRIKYHINISNPLTDKIKQDYKEIFSITRGIVQPLEKLVGQKVNDDELAYIAIHFGGWLKRNALTVNERILRIMIVCPNGIGTSRIMENQMINLLPEYEIVSLFAEKDYEGLDSLASTVDFVVSSVPLEDKGVPVIVVNPLFSSKDKETLLTHGKLDDYTYRQNEMPKVDTLLDIIAQYAEIKDSESLKEKIIKYLAPTVNTEPDIQKPLLKDLLTPDRIQVVNTVEDWENAIDIASGPLIEDECIAYSYVTAMKKLINDKGTYMVTSDSIAFPHALPADGVRHTGMSLLLVKNSIEIKDKPVKLFIVLASEDNEKHLKAMGQLTGILSDRTRKNYILNAEDRREIIKVLNFNEGKGDGNHEIPDRETDRR
ncbi:BglG family transcription antiterminator [Salinicoccus carnicancri]|uniref:BglG family transcription antiterminator n=1 Tax=Salinicoccus carnicancri TaxID=558170 RepID=UPI0003161651|nr:BglG family transcription antiterminator [Salinicoccus carnicancri]